jgi:hypothetical protein
VLVSVPAFFGDEDTRACTLVDIEPAGLWLACDELKDRLATTQEIAPAWTEPVTAFFPFSQVLYLVDPSQFAVLARTGQKPVMRRPTTPSPPKDVRPEDANREGRRKHKDSKSRR